MTKQTRTRARPKPDPAAPSHGALSMEQRETMIREAAYYHYVNRGYAPGGDLDDWLAAEAEIEHGRNGAEAFPGNTVPPRGSGRGTRKKKTGSGI